ncbi:MAG: hypothetical protein KJO07_25385 [Deltaproteobacteria bacterium]|nr:hypothetical protein [Deltaproteobacteria bacterium]
MKPTLAAIAIAFITLLAGTQVASADAWKHSVEFKYAKSSSIRIVEPEGLKVVVEGREDTVPAVFKFANQANYYRVQVTAKDGKTWTKKIEVKAHRETVLRVSYTPKGKAPQTQDKKVQTFIGKARNTCRRKVALRFEFKLGADKKATVSLVPRQTKDVELPAGSYKVRVYNATTRSKKWNYLKTFDLSVKSDGWSFAPSC